MLEIVILSAVIFSLPVSPKDFTLYEIIAPGSFHGEEVKSETDGEIWLGVFETASGYELRSAVMAVEEAIDPYIDRNGERTARLIYAEGAVIDSENDWDYETDRMLARACFS